MRAPNYIYVDGECHYRLAEKVWKHLHGEEADLAKLTRNPGTPGGGSPICHHADSKFFWDGFLPHPMGMALPLERKYYFTTYTGTPDGLHQAKVHMRNAGFEPHVVLEEKDLAKQRANALKGHGLLIKGKGIDIAMTVRILEDAQNNNFSTCALLTSP